MAIHTYTREQAEAINARAATFKIGDGHAGVRIASAGVIDHFDGWEGFEAASEELAAELEPVWSVYADLLLEKAA